MVKHTNIKRKMLKECGVDCGMLNMKQVDAEFKKLGLVFPKNRTGNF